MREFEGRVAVVTGAASGIGRGLARRCSALGMSVVLADVDEPALDALRGELAASGTRTLACPTDVSRSEAVEALAERSFEEFGAVHLVFNNAGVLTSGRAWEASLEDWRWTLGVNLWGVIHGIHAFVPRLLAQEEEAHVVNTASIGGLLAGPLIATYGTSKQAVVGISEALHFDLVAVGAPIRVSVLCPSAVATDLASCERHRPEELTAPVVGEPPEDAFRAGFAGALAAGASPEELAEEVFAGIREERFWILPHPGFEENIRKRAAGILEGRDPGE